jgi:diaminopimelate decarboxylase
VGRDGHVRIRTHDLAELADTYGTPLYVYDAETIRASLREYVDAFFRYRPVRGRWSHCKGGYRRQRRVAR